MKSTLIIISIFLSIVACSRNVDRSLDLNINELSIRSNFAGINIQKNYKTTFDSDNRLEQIRYQEIGYGDTLIVNYTIDYESNGLPFKIYSQFLKSFGGIDSIPRIAIEFEYENDTLKSLIYDQVILGDINYQKGNLKSLVYDYFDYNADMSKYIDTTRTRKFWIETDSRGNITRAYERKLYKKQYFDVKLTYDSMPNPYYLNVLCLIPEPDFIPFFSKNNWTQTMTNDDSSKIIESRSITYNKLKYPTIIKSVDEFDFVSIDSINYKSRPNGF